MRFAIMMPVSKPGMSLPGRLGTKQRPVSCEGQAVAKRWAAHRYAHLWLVVVLLSLHVKATVCSTLQVEHHDETVCR